MVNETQAQEPKLYTVRNVNERILPDTQGRLREVMQVTFEMPQGFFGTVDIPKADATPENVKAALDKRAGEIAVIYGL